jgi:hypothetical protein
MLKENSRKVLDYVMAADSEGRDITVDDIVRDLGLTKPQVGGIITSAFQKKGFMFRDEQTVEAADGTTQKVKYIRMTDEGRSFDFDAPDEK